MRRRLHSNVLFVGGAVAVALVLTFLLPTPQGIGDLARAAPGKPGSSVKKKHNLRALTVFNRTLVRVRDRYVDTGRIDTKEMLYEALDSVQFHIPEVLVDPDRAASRVTVTVNDKKREFSTADVASPWRLSGKLKEIFAFIEENMDPGADLAEVEYAAVNGMLGTLDPHSSLLDPDLAAEMDVNTSGKFGGLGILIGMRDRKLVVIRPFKGTPAMEVGIKADDHIVKIGDEITENLTVNEAADRMRGEPGTDVVLWIKREGESGLLRFPITRDNIRVPSVESKLLGKGSPKLGYLKIKQFAATTTTELASAMKDLRAQGAKGWVMDLRGNPGGLLEQAISVSDLFLDKGTIVTTVSGKERESRRASRGDTDTNSPVVVLINGNSASASEIVAGALKNNERALTVGTSSFGKGSVQILYDNDDGSKLKLTIAEYLTPKDLSIQSVGIVPDVELFRMYVPDKNDGPRDYLRLVRSRLSHGEKELKASLRSKYAKKPLKPDFHLSFVYERKATRKGEKKKKEEDDDATGPPNPDNEDPDSEEIRIDFEIELASMLLRNAGRSTRRAMLKKALPYLRQRQTAETQKLTTKLGNLGVDWSAPVSAKTGAQLTTRFEVEDHGKILKAGETVKLTGHVTNNGAEPAYRVHAKLASESYIFNDAELSFGKIEPGATKSWTTKLRVPDTALDGHAVLRFGVEGLGFEKAKAAPLRFRIAAAERPVFAYTHQLIEVKGNGDGLVQRGESYKLSVTVRNSGAGVAKETSAVLRNASGTAIKLKKARFEVGELKPGDERSVEFEFDATKNGSERELVVELMVNDWNLRESVVEKLKYPVAKAKTSPVAQAGSVEIKAARAILREGAYNGSTAIANATKGAVFKATGKLGVWYRVEGPSGRVAFVHEDVARRSKKRPSGKRVSSVWQVTPPKIKLTIPSYEVSGANYKLRGVVSDDTQVNDVYIFVSNRGAKIDNRKVYYRSNRGGKSVSELAFAGDVPLWPGSNVITVVARENGDVKAAETFTLYREDGSQGARAELRPSANQL